MKRLSPTGTPILTQRQIQALTFFYRHRKRRPSLSELARHMQVGSRIVARGFVYRLIDKGYVEHTCVRKHRPYRLTEKGLAWCRAYVGAKRRLKNTKRNEALRQRNRFIYCHRMQGLPYRRIVFLLERGPTSWPPVTNLSSVAKWAKRYAENNGLPAPIEWVRAKGYVRRKG